MKPAGRRGNDVRLVEIADDVARAAGEELVRAAIESHTPDP
ncbi:MAG: hypothetical protein ACKVXR_18355 [Planctomycetota bacterium]